MMRAKGVPLIHTEELKRGEPLVYRVARVVGYPFRYDVVGLENIQTDGPALFISNHLGSVGPLAVMLSVPIRFFPWIVTEMMEPRRAPQYLYDDFVHPVLHLSGRLGLSFSTLLAKISVRLFTAIGAVSIDRFGGLTPDGFRHSLQLLRDGKNLLIFPENALLALDEETLMRPFMPGFASLCHLFLLEQHLPLPVYPIAVHSGSETVSIGEPEFYCPTINHHEAINSFNKLLEDRIRGLYMELKINYDPTFL